MTTVIACGRFTVLIACGNQIITFASGELITQNSKRLSAPEGVCDKRDKSIFPYV